MLEKLNETAFSSIAGMTLQNMRPQSLAVGDQNLTLQMYLVGIESILR